MYYKEIIYLTGFCGTEKIGNIGYVKVEIQNEDATFSLILWNLPASADGTYDVRILETGSWKEVRSVTIRGGRASETWSTENVSQVHRVEMLLAQTYRIEGISKSAGREDDGIQPQKSVKPRRTAEEKAAWKQLQRAVGQELQEGDPQRTLEQELSERELQRMKEEKSVKKQSQKVLGQKSQESQPQRMAEEESPEKLLQNRIKIQGYEEKPDTERYRETGAGNALGIQCVEHRADTQELKEDKWEQLLHTYEVIHPYGDERAYVRVEPKDFVVMQAKYQHLVNNSFLLHGFYNYRYLILGREKGDIFYLGVPGVYYDREKMVALMFGFEAFECEGGSACPGGFGYYLRRVEL